MTGYSNEELLQNFFSSDNKVQYINTSSNSIKKVNDARESLNSSSQMKYMVSFDGSFIRYYVFCDDLLLTSQIKEWMSRSLGTSHTYLTEMRTKPVFKYEEMLLNRYNHGVIVVTQMPPSNIYVGQRNKQDSVLLKEDNVYIDTVIKRTIEALNRRPTLEVIRTRPLGRILRDFYWSCNQCDGKKAFEFFEEIKKQELLDYRNITSIELQAYEAGNEWEKIISHHQLEHLLCGVVSLKVTELVLKAHLQAKDIDVDKLNQINWYELEDLLIDHQAFFLRKPMLKEKNQSSVYYWKAWAIIAFALNITDFESHIPSIVPSEWLSSLLKVDRKKSASNILIESPLTRLVNADANLQNAVELLKYGETCFESEIRPLVEWLFELPLIIVRQIKSQKVLRNIFNQMEEVYYELFPITFEGISEVEDVKVNSPDDDGIDASTLIPSQDELQPKVKHVEKHIESWHDWFCGKEKALSVSYEYFREWPIECFDGLAVLTAIEETSDADVIRNVLPHFLKWIDDNLIKPSASLWVVLLELIAMDENKSIITIEILHELAERCLTSDHSKDEYVRVVDGLSICLEDGLTLHTLSKFIDVFDLLYQHTSLKSQNLAVTFRDTMVVFGCHNWGKYTVSQRVIFSEMHYLLLSYEFSPPKCELEHEQKVDLTDIQGVVGIYSLSESALMRAKGVITKYCPKMQIILNSDKTNTSALTNMVKKSDRILFCDRSAAHQAYFAIKAISKNITYVNGKGSTSIVRTFFDSLS